MSGKYTIGNFVTLLRNPQAILGEINHLLTELNKKFHRRYYTKNGKSVMAEDWDTLIILDGCRYDLFEAVNTIDGDLSQVQSLGSTSSEFLRENFEDGCFHDTVYISANPFMNVVGENTFHKLYSLIKTEWDETHQTVLPEDVVAATLKAHKEHPDKRLIVHFMQPHYPFLGETGEKISHRGISSRNKEDQNGSSNYTVWGQLQYRIADFSEEMVWKAYRENLELVLPHVATLIDELDGKSVISSDHGNMVGDRQTPIPVKGYGHTGELRVEGLVDVPWLVVDSEDRRPVKSEPPTEQEIETATQDKLEALGYV